MQTGERFWQLVGAAIFILCAYGLAELFDSNTARQKQLANQQQLLVRQQAALKESRWDQKLKDAEQVQKAWLAYLPVENLPLLRKHVY
jgi:chromosome condensin MukBEF complex kleisin-like MukF subunit